MANKKKNEELDFLYLDDKYQGKKKKSNKPKNSRAGSKSAQVKGKKNSKKDDVFDFDNEIVIGVTKVETNKKADMTKKKKKVKSATNNKKKVKKEKVIKNNKGKSKDKRLAKSIVKWTSLSIALILAIIFFMMSPLFNIIKIEVTNNEKISTDTIISLSKIEIGENIYKVSSRQIEKNIKQNAYIDSVKITRTLPNIINISVKERKATFMIEYLNSYAYINNQGYILEISEEKLPVPIIEDYFTSDEEIKVGNRLNEEDLERLAMVLKIVESANSNEIANLITRISIKDKQNYTLNLEEKNKIVYLGDASNISTRMLYLKAIIAETEGQEGEIFINGDLNSENVFFREKE